MENNAIQTVEFRDSETGALLWVEDIEGNQLPFNMAPSEFTVDENGNVFMD